MASLQAEMMKMTKAYQTGIWPLQSLVISIYGIISHKELGLGILSVCINIHR